MRRWGLILVAMVIGGILMGCTTPAPEAPAETQKAEEAQQNAPELQ